jgi:hypothetical protein
VSQSRGMSLIEAIANVAVGYGLAVATQIVVFPWFGLHASLGDNLAISFLFTGISLIRSFALRRLFEAMKLHKKGPAGAGPKCDRVCGQKTAEQSGYQADNPR